MTSPALAPIASKLAPIIARLSTSYDGERLACIAAIERLLAGRGLTFLDLADAVAAGEHGEPDHAAIINAALALASLTEWERDFVASLRRIVGAGRGLSEKQAKILRRIYAERAGASQ
jgi:hypothetical protein